MGFYEKLHGKEFDTLDEQQSMKTVPFVVWTNYDMPSRQVECTSLNYLPRYIFEAAGFSLPPYYQFLEKLEETIPAINADGFYSREKKRFLSFSDAAGAEAKALQDYRCLCYNNAVDRKHINRDYFPDYK